MVVADSHTVLKFELFAQSQDGHDPLRTTLGITDSEPEVTDRANSERYGLGSNFVKPMNRGAFLLSYEQWTEDRRSQSQKIPKTPCPTQPR